MQPEYVIMVIVAAALGGSFLLAKRLRYNKFLRKYDDSTIVKKILKNQYWEGQTEAQLIDSLGKPQDKDEKTFKAKKREVWKYNQTGKNRFALRVTLEDHVVVGWEKKA